MNKSYEQQIVETWHCNSRAWTDAVRNGDLESRVLVTDRAILEAVLERVPAKVLDVGCGEGWLARELAAHGIDVTGIDVVPELIGNAAAAGGGRFHVATYQDFPARGSYGCFDVVICNFSLLGETSVDDFMAAAPGLLNRGGYLIVQTLHPVMMAGDGPYRDGWREGSWGNSGTAFTEPAPWYFRTLGNWVNLFSNNGFRLLETREPIHPSTQKPASIIFICQQM